MTERFEIIRPRNLFIVGNTGVQIARDASCEHGQHAIAVSLFGRHLSQDGHTKRLDTVLPRCVIAELFGTIQAQISHDEGDGALQAFLGDVAQQAERSRVAMERLHNQGRDCCEAAFRTGGREHTCGRNETQQ